MVLVILITLSAYVILSFVIPFMKGVRWVENASTSYYLSYSWIEDALYFLKNRSLLNTDSWTLMPNTSVWFAFQTYSTWNIVPKTWKWNSEYNKNYNTISQTNPLQLEVWNWYINSFNEVKFIFRVPDFDGDWVENDETLSWGTLPILYWTLSSSSAGDTLYASWTYIEAQYIKRSNCSSNCDWSINDKLWVNLYGSWYTFQNFFINNCTWTASGCVLKMTVINKLKLTSGQEIPYLEYQISWLSSNFPDRYTRIESYGKSYWFQKKLEVNIPQQTVNQAFDFTVFQ